MDNQPLDFETAVEQHKGILYKVANSYCRQADDRKDLAQEIIIQLWKSFPTYRGDYKFSTWMYRVALNVAISYYRADSRRRKVSMPLTESVINMQYNPNPDEKEDQLSKLQLFINELNELDRALMILYLEERAQREIADILGLTETNVSTKIGRIKEKLKVKFQLTNE